MGKTRRVHTKAFQIEAVKLVTEQNYSYAQAAENLGIAESLLRRWKQQLDQDGEQAFPGQGKLPALEEQLRQLREKNKRLKMERDILKKSDGLLCQGVELRFQFSHEHEAVWPVTIPCAVFEVFRSGYYAWK